MLKGDITRIFIYVYIGSAGKSLPSIWHYPWDPSGTQEQDPLKEKT